MNKSITRKPYKKRKPGSPNAGKHLPLPRKEITPEWTIDTVRHPDNPLNYIPVHPADGSILDYGLYKRNKKVTGE